MNKFDVVVIGLGAVGSATLYQLSKSGLSVAGIDKYAPPHDFGSSFGESRVTRQAIGEGTLYTPLVLRANEIWQELEQATGLELYDRCGMLIAGYEKQRFFKNTLKAAKDHSIDHQLLDGEAVEQRFPAMKTVDSDQTFYYEPRAGYLRPEQCIEAQLKLARDNGATTLLNTTVESITENAGSVQVRLNDNQTITAGKVVVAAGPWIKELLPATLTPLLKTYLQTFYWFDIDKTHFAELMPRTLPVFLGGWEHAQSTRAFSGFPALAGPDGGVKFSMDESAIEINPDDKDQVQPKVADVKELYEQISRYIRYIKPTTLRSYNCVYTATPDSNFIVDFAPGSQRIIIGSACSSHGFKHSAATGEILAQLATDKESTFNIRPFSINRRTLRR